MMIKINECLYKIKEIEVNWGNFSMTSNKETINGISPDINIYIEDNKKNTNNLMIETIFSNIDFKNLKINETIDFKKFISDIIYMVNDKAIFLLQSTIYSELSKLDLNLYNLKLKCDYEELGKCIRVDLDSNIMIEVY